MNPSDFDLLCAGASPEETRRLCKLLNEWCAGDENEFVPLAVALRGKSRLPFRSRSVRRRRPPSTNLQKSKMSRWPRVHLSSAIVAAKPTSD